MSFKVICDILKNTKFSDKWGQLMFLMFLFSVFLSYCKICQIWGNSFLIFIIGFSSLGKVIVAYNYLDHAYRKAEY